MTDAVKQWVLWQLHHACSHCPKKLAAQTCLLLFVPSLGFQQVGIHFWTDHEAVTHSPSLRLSRASNSSHGMAASGFFSCAAMRLSISAFSASVSGSSLSSHSSPSIS